VTVELEGKVALVTGGGSGIGQAVVQALADGGAAVCINWFGDHGADARDHASRLDRGMAYEADVADPEAVAEMVRAVVDRLGGLDALINNAAVNRSGRLLDVDLDTWDAVMRVNLRGAFCCSQAAGRAMREAGRGGSIVNISSIHEDLPFPMFSPYAAAKGGVRMLMRTAALELAELGIRVNNIAPGAILTPLNQATLNDPDRTALLQRLIPQRRLGLPEEVAALTVFLCSDQAAYITGATYTIDGGMSRYAEPV
jgi:glucose 1-dehydrogenase